MQTPSAPPVITPYRLSVAKYDAMIAAGILTPNDPLELLDGQLSETMPIGPRHAACVRRLNELFFEHIFPRATIGIQDPVHLGEHSEPEPGALLLRRREGGYPEHPTPADVLLLVEVADTTLRLDRDVKAPLYARAGIREYWIVNLADDVLHVHRDPQDEAYADVQTLARDASVSPLAFPDTTFSVDDLLP